VSGKCTVQLPSIYALLKATGKTNKQTEGINIGQTGSFFMPSQTTNINTDMP
jgi:hypothetical protein